MHLQKCLRVVVVVVARAAVREVKPVASKGN
jgi:hypothetical protein